MVDPKDQIFLQIAGETLLLQVSQFILKYCVLPNLQIVRLVRLGVVFDDAVVVFSPLVFFCFVLIQTVFQKIGLAFQ